MELDVGRYRAKKQNEWQIAAWVGFLMVFNMLFTSFVTYQIAWHDGWDVGTKFQQCLYGKTYNDAQEKCVTQRLK